MSNIEERVIKMVAEQLGVKEDDIQSTSSFVEDLGADSLDTVELKMRLITFKQTGNSDFEKTAPNRGRFFYASNICHNIQNITLCWR